MPNPKIERRDLIQSAPLSFRGRRPALIIEAPGEGLAVRWPVFLHVSSKAWLIDLWLRPCRGALGT